MPIDLYCGCGNALSDYRERVSGWCTSCLDRQATPKTTAAAAVQDEEDEPESESEDEEDPVTRRLMDDALKTHGQPNCPQCWHPGRFIRMALVCPKHGAFAGV